MNRTDIRDLLIKISAYKPAQQYNKATAPAWHEALSEYDYEDANRAVVELAGEVEWIGVHDVVKRVKHYRAERVDHGFADLFPPSGLNPAEYLAWSRDVRKRLAAGEPALQINEGRTLAQLPAHDVRQLLGNPR